MITIRNQVAIVVYLEDGSTTRSIERAEVVIGNSEQSFIARAKTKPDGIYYFTDLAAGTYTVSASLPGKGSRYGSAQQIVNVSVELNGDINLVSLSMSLNPTTLTGTVRGLDGENVEGDLVLAEVRIKGGESLAYTDSLGIYTLNEVEVGARTLQFSAVGYASEERDITLTSAGESLTQNIVLS